MADEVHYASGRDTHKRKYDDTTPPPPPPSTGRRSTGFSAPIVPPAPDFAAAPQPPSYNSAAAAVNEILLAKQKAEAIAARLLDESEAKRPKHENGGFDSNPYASEQKMPLSSNVHAGSTTISYSYQGTSKRVDIPNNRVGVIIGKAGETIKYLQTQSGAKIQVTRDMDADLNAPTRPVELMGTPDQIAKAEQLINEVLTEAEAGGSGIITRRLTGQVGSEQFVMKIPNNKVGLVIGKGGETIKSIQARSGARVQVIPLHPPPGDMSTERTVQIDGSPEQVEAAKQLVIEVTSGENRVRSSNMGGGYPQQGYEARPPANWAPGPPVQQSDYAYAQPGAYSGPSPHYSASQATYAGYPESTSVYPTTWDQTSVQASHQAPQGNPYDYYNQQQQPSQQPASSGPTADNTGYNYSQYAAATTYNQQGHTQEAYGGGYTAPGSQAGYGQPATNPQQGYDQQQGYTSAANYGNMTNPPQDGQNPPSYATQGGETGQATTQPVQGQQGYNAGQQPPNSAYTGQGGPNQLSYAMPPTSQPSYGTPNVHGGYGGPGYRPPPPAQKAAANPPPVYGQPQQSPTQGGGYGYSAPAPQAQHALSQPPPAQSQSGYPQTEAAGAQRTPTTYSSGSATSQPGSYPSPYGAAAAPTYAQQPPPYSGSYGVAYTQSPAYPADGSTTPATTTQAAANQTAGVAKTSPQS
ncbi:hypothetical protein Dimus_008785 [Dionaea muscipula]